MIASCGMRARWPRIVENTGGADEREREADPVRPAAVGIAAGERQQQRDGRAERRDLRQRQVHEDDAALDDVHAEVGVDAGEDQAGGERRRQEVERSSSGPSTLPAPA
mgnify:CR=1 FL=1